LSDQMLDVEELYVKRVLSLYKLSQIGLL